MLSYQKAWSFGVRGLVILFFLCFRKCCFSFSVEAARLPGSRFFRSGVVVFEVSGVFFAVVNCVF